MVSMVNEISRRRIGLIPCAAKSFAWKWRPVLNKIRKAQPAASAIQSIFLRAASRNVTPAMIQTPITGPRPDRRFPRTVLRAKAAGSDLVDIGPLSDEIAHNLGQ